MPVDAWAACLSDHPDRAYCDYLLWGGRWRLIVDLSFPRGHSVNDGTVPPWERQVNDQSPPLALSQTCVASTTPPWMRHVRGWWPKGGAPVWLSSMWKERSELCQCIQMIGGCWACSGEALSMWTIWAEVGSNDL